ncbi:hypothetical protein L3Y34_015653 [Caenorhabditis briggsae]|uniref:Uncharacterized protein n=2 Tax=Caenorhabditis briggsae TaxID=6238 RepID=A0AAE9J018_CAEBR|nr:hypothetical protein L3Y34_015653 [Caenorhabditis briggsae]
MMKRKQNKRKVFSDSDNDTAVTETEAPVRVRKRHLGRREREHARLSSNDNNFSEQRNFSKRTTSTSFSTASKPFSMNPTIDILSQAPSMFLERNQFPSLWITLPQKTIPLLEFVLEKKLISVLPGPLKVFLADWLMAVKRQMKGMLQNDVLRKKIKSVMAKDENILEHIDVRLRNFLREMLVTVLQTEEFAIFENGPWLPFAQNITRNVPLTTKLDETQLKILSTQLNKNVRDVISSFFTGPRESKSDIRKIYHQILLFVVKFTLNTLRHVLKFDPQTLRFFYDGEIEDEATTKSNYQTTYQNSHEKNVVEERVVNPLKFLLPTPAVVPKIDRLPRDFDPTVPPPQVTHSSNNGIKKSFIKEFNPVVTSNSSLPASNSSALNNNLLEEVTEEELLSARNLRPSSVASATAFSSLSAIDREKVPEKWINAYKMTLEINRNLKAELGRLDARHKELKEEVNELKAAKLRRNTML